MGIEKFFLNLKLNKNFSKNITEKITNKFDFIYIDGSHQAADVLSDAVNAFKLLRPGGIMCFDDYLWHWADRPYNPLDTPKAAIDAFTMIYAQKLQVLALPPSQLFIEKKE